MNRSDLVIDAFYTEAQLNPLFSEAAAKVADLVAYFDSISCEFCNDTGITFEGPTRGGYFVRSCSCTDEVSDVADLFPAQAQAARMKVLLARLDEACAKALAPPPVYTVKWAPIIERPVQEPHVAPARCICESHWACMAVLRADEFNERRALPTVDDLGREVRGQDEWEVSDLTRKIAREVEGRCPAAHHYTAQLANLWLGQDVTTVDWSDPLDEKALQTRIACEDELAAYSTRNETESRFEGEYANYDSHEAWLRQLTEHRRNQLAALIRHLHGGTISNEAAAWVQERIEAKQGNLLRAYSSCIFQLRRAVETGKVEFPVAGVRETEEVAVA